METTAYSIIDWITGLVLVGTGITTYFLSDKSLSAKIFSVLCLFTGLWSLFIAISVSILNVQLELWLIRTDHFLGTIISVTFLLFSIVYPNNVAISKKITYPLLTAELFFIYVIFFTELIIGTVTQLDGLSYLGWTYGPLTTIYDIYFIACWLIGIHQLYIKFKIASQDLQKQNLKLMLFAFIVGLTPPTILTILMPQAGMFAYYWLAPISCIFWLLITAYSMVKHHMFSIRLIASELVIFVLWVFILLRILLASSYSEAFIESGLLVVTVIFGVLLVRGVLSEIRQRERIQSLAAELQVAYEKMSDVNTLLSQKVAEQTDEIRKSYEAEKQARQELEKLNDAKDQFIMITQHHLRTPLVSVIWEIESVANGVYGAVTAELRKAIAGMKTSTDRLMQIVNDFLNITAIKIGTNILNLSEQSLKPAIEYIIQQLAPEIRHMDIKIDYPRDDSSWPKLKIDYDKMREILLIVIENAVRYNHPGGSVAISTGVSDGAFELTVQNTGIGISDEEKQKIGSALFYRGASARKSHPIGMGIGLAVVKAIVRAHHGTFNIESLGEGRGAKATISLPVQ